MPAAVIMQYYGILRVWLPRTTQIINKKGGVAGIQGNNEGSSGTDVGGDEKLIFKFMWPYCWRI